MEADQIRFAMPPDFIFKKDKDQKVRVSPQSGVIGANVTYDLEKVEYPETGGIFAWFRDCPYPAKGFPFPQALYAIDIAKKTFRESFAVLGKMDKVSLVLFGLVMAILPKKQKVKIITGILDGYYHTTRNMLMPFLLDETRYSPLSGELRIFVKRALLAYGINEETSENFSELVGMIIQYDNAYYLRLEDILSETDKAKLIQDPPGEIRRIMAILRQRELGGGADKMEVFGKILSRLLIVPRYRKIFTDCVRQSNFYNFQWDEADIYHTLLWGDYNFRGQPIEVRQGLYIKYHTDHPPFPPRREIRQ